jgi:hypothetical protein
MARTTSQPSTAARRTTRTTRSDSNGRDSLDEQNRDNRLDDTDERREGLSSVHDEQDADRDNSRDDRENADERNDADDRREQQPANLAASMDTFAPVLEAWKQVFKSWSELTETMVKVQQDAFASMVSGANAHTKDLNLGENRNGERAFSGPPITASINRDRR